MTHMDAIIKMLLSPGGEAFVLPDTCEKAAVLPFVKAAQEIHHVGDLRIAGGVGKSAKLEIKKGSLTIDGPVEDGARLTVSNDVEKNGDLTIGGHVGNGVAIESSGDITLLKGCGYGLYVRGCLNFQAGLIYENADINAGRSVTLSALFRGGAVDANGDIVIDITHGYNRLSAGRDIVIRHADVGTCCLANRDIRIETADMPGSSMAGSLQAGRDIKIDNMIGRPTLIAPGRIDVRPCPTY